MSRARAGTVEVLLGAVLVVACAVMPWATYKDVASGTTTGFRGGPLSSVLLAVGVVSIAVALFSIVRSSKAVLRLHLATGAAAVVISIALALSKISDANHFDQQGPSQTAYAVGSVVGVVASLAIAVTSFVRLSAARPPGQMIAADVPGS